MLIKDSKKRKYRSSNKTRRYKNGKARRRNVKGKVTSTVFKGVHYEIELNENGRLWILHNTKNAEVGTELGMDIYPEDIHIMRKENN